MKYRVVTDPKDIPSGPHYAVLMPRSIYIPADEESQRRPGHGYDAHTVHAWDYYVFNSQRDWTEFVEDQTRRQASSAGGERFVPIAAARAKVTINVDVRIETNE